jgi:hypothetical protein
MMDTRKLAVGQKVWLVAGPRLSEVFPGGSSGRFSLRSDVLEAKVVKVTESCVEVEHAEGPIGLSYQMRFDIKGKVIWSGDIYKGNWAGNCGIPVSPDNGPWELVDTEPYFDWTPTPRKPQTRFQALMRWLSSQWFKFLHL